MEQISIWADINDAEKLNSNPNFKPIYEYIIKKEKYSFMERSEYGKLCLGNLEIIIYMTSADIQRFVEKCHGIEL